MLRVTKSTNPPPDAATHYGNASFLRRLGAASLSDAGGNLMIFLGLAVLAVFTTGASNADESDQALPDVISNAKTTVEVLMRHAISTGECFPDPDAKARFENGRVVLEDFKRYINIEPRLFEGLVAFQLDGKWGACDKDGKVVIAAKYQSGFEFHEGMAGADEDGKLGFIDKEGKWLIQPRFDTDYRWNFMGDVCPVAVGGKCAVIDKKGAFVWEPGLLRAEILGGGIFIQTDDNREGFLDNSGKLIPNGKPNHHFYHPESSDEDVGKPIAIPKDKADQVRMVRNIMVDSQADGDNADPSPKIARLVASGLDLRATDEDGNTPLLAVADSYLPIAKALKVLLDAGADVSARNHDGSTALHLIIHWAKIDLDAVRLLIQHGISVEATDNSGDPAFESVYSALDEEPEPGQEPDTQLAAAKLLLAAGAGKWKEYMGGPVTVVPEIPSRLDPTVARLRDDTLRNEAFRTILSWQKYRSGSYTERICKPLRHVEECPQKEGPSIFAVFPMTSYQQQAAPLGHIILIDADGALIPHYSNANSLDEHSAFKDINGDGIVDEVGTINRSGAHVLHVLPVTREQKPVLNIALREREFATTEWSWELAETGESGIFVIVLGPLDSVTGKITPKARYVWSKETGDYVGPPGGMDLPFLRLKTDDPSDSLEFGEYVKKQKDRKKLDEAAPEK
jgi:WG containing repeat/Ankyrin repeat